MRSASLSAEASANFGRMTSSITSSSTALSAITVLSMRANCDQFGGVSKGRRSVRRCRMASARRRSPTTTTALGEKVMAAR